MAGQTPTLFAAFLYFDLSFMVRVLLGLLAVQTAADLHLTAAQKGLMVATPVLAGAPLPLMLTHRPTALRPTIAAVSIALNLFLLYPILER